MNRIFQATKYLLAGLLAFLLFGFSLVIFFPGPVMRVVGPLLPKKSIVFSPGKVTGNLWTGLSFQNLKLQIPTAEVDVAHLKIAMEWRRLFHKTVAFKFIELTKPFIVCRFTGSTTKSDKNPAKKSSWTVVLDHVRVEEGHVQVLNDDPDNPIFIDVNDIDVLMSYKSDHLDFQTAHAVVSGQAKEFPLLGELSYADNRGHWNLTSSIAGGTNINMAGQISGFGPSMKWVAQGSFTKAAFNSISVADGSLKAHGQGWPPQNMEASLTTNGLKAGPNQFDNAQLNITGSTSSHHLSLQIKSTDYALLAEGKGNLVEKIWHMNWSTFNLHAIQDWRLARPFTSTIGSKKIQITYFDLVGQSAHVKAEIDYKGDRFEKAEISASGFDLGNLSNTHLISFPVKGNGQLDVNLKGLAKALEGTASFDITNLELDGSPIGEIEGQAKFSQEKIQIDRLNLKAPGGQASLTGLIFVPTRRQAVPDFNLKFIAKNLNLGPLLKRSPVQFQTSQLNADLKLSHQKREFLAEGPLTLSAGEANFPDQGIVLKDFITELQGTGSELNIIRGNAKAAKKGELSWAGSVRRSKVDVQLKAKELTFDTNFGFSGRTNADLALNGTLEEPKLSGRIEILKADFMPDRNRKGSKKEKEIPPSEEKSVSNSSSNGWATDLIVHFDNNVWYKEKQTAIETKGNLNLRKTQYEPALIFGTVETVRGDYIFMGRSFKIEQGRLIFSGEEKANPTLDVRTLYVEEVSKTKITLTVSGTVEKPILELSSDPPMEQTDIISVIVTGKPMDDLGKSGGTNNQAMAREVVANYFAEQLRQRVQNRAQIDVLKLKIKDSNQTDVTVGKNISKRLYVAYGQTLGPHGEERVEAQYSLGHDWNLQGYTASEGNYVIDLLYQLGLR